MAWESASALHATPSPLPHAQDAFLVRIMLSITDFQSFVEMMREVAEEVQSAGERKE